MRGESVSRSVGQSRSRFASTPEVQEVQEVRPGPRLHRVTPATLHGTHPACILIPGKFGKFGKFDPSPITHDLSLTTQNARSIGRAGSEGSRCRWRTERFPVYSVPLTRASASKVLLHGC